MQDEYDQRAAHEAEEERVRREVGEQVTAQLEQVAAEARTMAEAEEAALAAGVWIDGGDELLAGDAGGDGDLNLSLGVEDEGADVQLPWDRSLESMEKELALASAEVSASELPTACWLTDRWGKGVLVFAVCLRACSRRPATNLCCIFPPCCFPSFAPSLVGWRDGQ